MENKIGLTPAPAALKEPLGPRRPGTALNTPPAKPDKEEFERLLGAKGTPETENPASPEANELKISAHAQKRISERKLEMDSGEFMKLREAINQLKSKGGRDSLVITEKAAYIVDVEKNTVVTAMAKGNLNKNIFTKIDSTVFID